MLRVTDGRTRQGHTPRATRAGACLCFTVGRGFAAAAEPLLQRVAPRYARIGGGVICPATRRTRDMLRYPIVDTVSTCPIPGSREGIEVNLSAAQRCSGFSPLTSVISDGPRCRDAITSFVCYRDAVAAKRLC